MKHPNTFNEKTNEVTGDKKDIKCQVQKENMTSCIPSFRGVTICYLLMTDRMLMLQTQFFL